MERRRNMAKWTRGRSTVERVTKGTKTTAAIKGKARTLPIKLLNKKEN